jgi:putative peptidoglycan lipid II flippase
MPPDAAPGAGALPGPPGNPGNANGRLARSAGLAGAATLASRLLGLARESVQAAVFGASNEMDAFLVAFRIPNLARDLFAEGAMSAAFVPTFTRYLTLRGKTDAWRLGNNVINALLCVSGLLVVVGIVFARPLVTAYAGDYAAVPGKLDLTVELSRVLMPFLTLVAIASAMMGMLNSLHHFFVPALSPAMFNIASIFCVVALVPLMPALGLPRIMAVAIGAILGGVGQIVIQWRPLRREGFRYRPILDTRDEGLRRILVLMGPGTLGLAATQINLLINTLLATSQGTGAVSWLTYAFRLMYLPIGLFGVSLATAVLPQVARHVALGDHQAMRGTVSRGLALMLAVNVPAMLGLIVLAEPITRLLFERGRFLPSDTAATADALRLYAVGLVGYSAVRIASPVFYALGRNRVPVGVSFGSIAVNIVASVLLVRLLGFRGLALSTSIAALINGGVLVWLLRGPLDGIEGRHLLLTFVKTLAAAAVMAAVAVGVERWVASVVGDDRLLEQSISLGVSISAGLVALAAAARLLRVREFDEVFALARERMRKLVGG